MLPDVHGHGIAPAFERVDPVQDAGGEQHQTVHHRWDRDHRAECGQRPLVSVLDRRAVGHQQFAASAAHVGVKHGGQQRKQETAAASTFQLVLVDVPVEIVVGVAPNYFGYNWDMRRSQSPIPNPYLVLDPPGSLSEAAVCRRSPTNEKCLVAEAPSCCTPVARQPGSTSTES